MTLCRGSLWEDSLWAVSGQATEKVGYDSNLFAIEGGPGDAFEIFKPSLVLSRKDSALDFEAEAWTDWTAFLRQTGNDSIDPGIRISLVYPANLNSLPSQAAEIHWIRTTDVNFDVGQRISRDDALAKYEGDLFDAANASVAGRLSFDRDEFLGAAYTTIDTAAVGTTVSYSPHDLLKTGVGYDLTLGRSLPNSPGLAALDQTEQAFTLQAQGELTPKVTGRVFVGAAYSDYTGGFSHSEWDMIAGAEATWNPRAQLAIEIQALRAPSFSANGDVDLGSSVELAARQELSRGLAIRVDAQWGHTDHERPATYRTDLIAGAGIGLDYNLTERFTASAGCDWTRQNSDISTYTYRRCVASLQVRYRI